jgi:glycosyltransferase involved in cell wall biosynthesis
MEETPLVTCLCLTTAGRSEFLERAVQCFRDQTYLNCELLIVPDSWDDIDAAEIDPMDEGFSVYVTRRKMNIGEKRNAGIGSVGGGLIAVWDDDDFSAPARLEFQVNAILSGRRAVTGFGSMKFTDGASWWLYTASAGQVIGSSLMFKRDWWDAKHSNPKFPTARPHHFPELQVGEEVEFCYQAAAAGELLSFPDCDLMWCSIHPGNTSARCFDSSSWWKLPDSVASAPR